MNFSDMVRHVAPYVQGAPDALIVDHLIKAGRRFCETTQVWNYETEPVITRVGVGAYDMDLDEQQELVKVLRATYGTSEIQVFDTFSGRAQARHQSGGTFLYVDGPDLMLYPAPVVAGPEIVLQVSVRPSLNATFWPDELDRYVDDLAHGAIASLALIPKVEWQDKDQAALQGAAFAARINAVGFHVAKGFSARAATVGNRFL